MEFFLSCTGEFSWQVSIWNVLELKMNPLPGTFLQGHQDCHCPTITTLALCFEWTAPPWELGSCHGNFYHQCSEEEETPQVKSKPQGKQSLQGQVTRHDRLSTPQNHTPQPGKAKPKCLVLGKGRTLLHWADRQIPCRYFERPGQPLSTWNRTGGTTAPRPGF